MFNYSPLISLGYGLLSLGINCWFFGFMVVGSKIKEVIRLKLDADFLSLIQKYFLVFGGNLAASAAGSFLGISPTVDLANIKADKFRKTICPSEF